MLLNGDISTFHPSNLLLFFADFDREGLLTVHADDGILNIYLKGAQIIDAQSNWGDEKILSALLYKKLLNRKQIDHIRKLKKDTDVPVQLIIERLKTFRLADIKPELTYAVQEVIFQLFFLKKGSFHLTNITIPHETCIDAIDCRQISLEVTRWIDEWREIERNLTSLDRPVAASPSPPNDTMSSGEYAICELAKTCQTIRQIITRAHFPSFHALKALKAALEKKYLTLTDDTRDLPAEPLVVTGDQLFHGYKEALKKLLLSDNPPAKMAALLGFCKDHFDWILLMNINTHMLVKCIAFHRNKKGTLQRTIHEQLNRPIKSDPVFFKVFKSNLSFFGKCFATSFIDGITSSDPQGDCAVIPINRRNQGGIIVYVTLETAQQPITAFHYLELLSWGLTSPPEKSATPESVTLTEMEAPPPPPQTESKAPQSPAIRLAGVVDIVDNLPTMPNVVSELLQALSDPDCSIAELTPILKNDQIMVARIIKVSNSALYGSVQTISSLKDALPRLGLKTIKSIVLSASVSSMFSKNQKQMGNSGLLLWTHSKECGLASRVIAKRLNYQDPEEAFVGGLLHDIGKLAILLKFTDEYVKIQELSTATEHTSIAIESRVLGFDHTQVGILLMKHWSMPESLRRCVRFHHQPSNSKDAKALVETVFYGNRLCHILSAAKKNESGHTIGELKALLPQLDLSDEEAEQLLTEVTTDFRNADIFD